MLLSGVVRLATRSLLRHKIRTGMTLFGIAVAILAFGLLRTVVDSWYAGAELGSSSRLITRHATSITLQLPLSHGTRMRGIPDVAGVTWANWFGGIYQDERQFFPQFAIDPASYFSVYPEYVLPPEQLAAFRADRRGAVVGEQLAQKYGWRVGDTVPLKGTVYPGEWRFTIRGIYRGQDAQVDTGQLFLHWSYVNEVVKQTLPTLADQVGIFVVAVDRPAAVSQVSARIDDLFRHSLSETRTESQKAFQLGFIALVDTILVAIQTVAYVVVLIMMAVMANTMAMAARERTREYATLRALGFQQGFVASLILVESLTLALLGGGLGLLLTYPVAELFFTATQDIFRVFVVTPTTVALQVLACGVIGLTAAIAPILSSRQLRIVDGLRAVT